MQLEIKLMSNFCPGGHFFLDKPLYEGISRYGLFPRYKILFIGLPRAIRTPESETIIPPPTTSVFHRLPNQLPLRSGVSIYR